MTAVGERRNGKPAPHERSWWRAIVAAGAMIVLSFVAFVFVPNTLLGYLSTRLVPTWRDLLVVLYWMAAFVGCCWTFVYLQRVRGA
jgi:predicted membrane metal-binding protein